MAIEQTVVELDVVSKKHGHQYGHKNNPEEWDIELAVPSDAKSIFYKMSGGTNFSLKTINKDAADMFIVGNTYVMTLEPKAPVITTLDTTTDPPGSSNPPPPKP